MTENSSLCQWEHGFGEPYSLVLATAYIIGIVVLFIAIAIVCDDYFVPSLELICKRLDLSEDVAGATFMAAGSSAPELFTSLAAVTNSSDIGVGTIVGSAVFNILIIISLSALLCKQVLILDWRPLTRDAVFYGISIIAFSIFAWDGKFTWWESLITLSYYFLYILTMRFNKRLFRFLDSTKRCFISCSSCLPCDNDVGTNGERVEDNKVHVQSKESLGPQVHITPPTDNGDHNRGAVMYYPGRHAGMQICIKGLGVPMTMNRTQSSGSSGIGSMAEDPPLHTEPDEVWVDKAESLESVCIDEETQGEDDTRNGDVLKAPSTCSPDDEEVEVDFDEVKVCCCDTAPTVMTSLPRQRDGLFGCIRYVLSIMYFFIAFPFQLVFSFTIPNTIKPHLKRYYLASFGLSVLWIAVLSYGMVKLAERFGCIMGLNDYIMGLVVVAAGTSVPDALSSVIVAREGHGDMAVSNALGSNVFDINLGLGLPFLIKCIYLNGPLVLIKEEVGVNYLIKPHTKFGMILFIILVLVFVIISLNKFRLTKLTGIIFILIYIVFVTYAVVQELLCDSYRC